MSSTKVQSTIKFRIRKPASVSKCSTSPVEDKIYRMKLRTPTPSKVKEDGKKLSVKKSGDKFSRNLFDADKPKSSESSLDVSPTKQRKSSSNENSQPLATSQPSERAKLLLNASYVENLVFRDLEYGEIMKFVSNRLEEEVAGSLYISGAPGTGKTLCVSHVLKHLEKKHSFKSVFVNCMDCRTPNAIYSKIVSGYGLLSPKTPTASLELIENKIVTPSKKRSKFTVVILDEIDKLECKNQEVLYTLFDLPRRYDSRLILIGISNTLDFTKRSLSRMLHLEFDNVVEMNFRPYSKDQVKGIIEMRLKEVTANCPLFNPSAIELCARKVAMHSGDVRKALHICRRALELAESERSLASKSNPILKSTSDDGQNENSPRKRKALNETPTEVLVSHVMKVMNEVYGSQTTKQPGKDVLPTQQQIILCSILIHSKKNNRKEVDLSKCYQIFSKICREKSIGYEIGNNSEFISMCHLLESKGFICIKPHSNRIQKIITLAIDEQDIEDMMTDRNLFKAILNDKAFC